MLGSLLLGSAALAQESPTASSPAQGQRGAYDRLADPAAAASLQLTEEQRAQIAQVLAQRQEALASAAEDQKPAIRAESDEKLAGVLSEDQREMFNSLFLKQLQFNFQYQKWADVLDWIAEESGLSLVMDAPPAGTFNYSDTKSYTPTEAIDLLNGWLQTKGYALVRRDRLLMLIDMTEGVPADVVPRVAVEELPSRGRFELVSVLVPLGGRPAEAAMTEIKPFLGRHGSVQPLPQTKQLLVTDTAGNLRAIRALVETLPVPSSPKESKPPEPVLAVYPLKHANPNKVGEVFKELLNGKFVVDAAASQVTVNAVPAEQERAKAIIAQLEANQGPENQPHFATYPAPRSNVPEVVATLLLAAPGAQIRLNESPRELHVWATPQDQKKIGDLLEQLGAGSDSAQSQLNVYSVTGMTPQAAMTALTTVLPGIRVTVDAAAQKLIVVGSLEDHQAVARLLDQLQEQGDPATTTSVRTYPLANVDANVTSLLTTLVPNARVTVDTPGERLVVVATGSEHDRIAGILEQLGADDADRKRAIVSYPLDRKLELTTVSSLLKTVVPRAQVTSDAKNHRLLIAALPSEHESVAATIEQVAKDAGVALPTLEFYSVQKVDGSRAVSVLQTLVPGTQITFDVAHKRLNVIARPDEHAVISDTLAKLESASQSEEERQLKVYDVKPVQKSRFSSLASGLSSELPKMQVLTDSEPGELAIWATPSEHAVIANILQQLERDIPEELAPKLVSYPILKTDAASLNTVLGPLFPNVRITVDAKANRLLIWARPAEHETLRQALQELDTDAPVESEFKLMAYPIDGIAPEIAAQMINAEIPGLTVITDPTSKTLLVRARKNEHDRIGTVLASLKDSGLATRERSVVVYPAIPGDPNEVYAFFARSIPTASVLVDRNTGRMSVWATAAEHQQISHAVADMMGTAAGGLQAVLRTYRIENAPAATVTTLVTQVAPTAKVAASADGRQLLVWARESDQELIQGVMAGLANGPGEGRSGSLAVFDVQSLGTTAARALLAPIVPGVSFSDAPDGRALLAWVEDQDREKIKAALDQVLADPQLSGERTLKIYSLENVGGQSAQQLLTATMPSISFTSTDGGRTVVVWGRQQDHERIAATISELQLTQPFRDERRLKVYSVRDLGPNVVTTLATLVPQAQVTAGPQTDQVTVSAFPADQQKVADFLAQLQASGRERERTVAAYDIGRADPEAVRQILLPLSGPDTQVSVDARSRRVYVRTYADKLADIEAMIKRITGPQAADAELSTKTYHVNQGDGDEAQEVLSALLPQAVFVTDSDRKMVVATATAEQHQLIDSVIRDMQGGFGGAGGVEAVAYPLKTSDPDSTLTALRSLFGRSSDVSLSVDRATRTLMAVARPGQQETIRKLVEQLDEASGATGGQSVAVYPMRGADRSAIIQVVERLLDGIDPRARVTYNTQTGHLIVTTVPEGHARLRELTEQMGIVDVPRDVKVFQLERLEPFSARLTLDSMFDDGVTSRADRPVIQTNEEAQQIIVRGTPDQIAQIRDVLVEMGEIALVDRSTSSRRVRVIPVDGDFEQAVPRIQQLWPGIRPNPLRILRPQTPQIEPPLAPPAVPLEPGSESSMNTLPRRSSVAGAQFVAFVQDDVEAENVDNDVDAEAVPPLPTEEVQPPADAAEPPPVVIIPGPDRITVVSDDIDALNQMESLLRSMFSRPGTTRGRDFTVYALQNAGAEEVAETLNDLFRNNRRITTSDVVVVPDNRLNALVVYAGRGDRERIETLIQTLDSANIPESLNAFQTRIVPVVHADALEIATTLRGIYKAQMTAGGARRNLPIPEGLPFEIANLLRQVNAATSSPLLTVEVDQTTNSLVLMAPVNLLDQVENLVTELDNSAAVSQARVLKIIPLKKNRSTRVMEILQRLTK